ncbi:hypothetical protein E2562_009772 [Oryza meyeriana var. granulata]|uniref:Uncharacterized protein n=1 Tax=Oryza meyeriana var. granulata TaxID=110450 RepID=A0A6G1EA76_9ORYZ|nr:hypothetical protein E2562_009772 [Oryza meyeriana var. granulata]
MKHPGQYCWPSSHLHLNARAGREEGCRCCLAGCLGVRPCQEEVKEVLSETAVSVLRPRPPEPEKEVVKRRLERKEEEEASESVASAAAEKAKAKCGGEREGEQKAVVGRMEKGRARTRTPEQRRPKEAGNGRTRSPSPASAQRRQVLGGAIMVSALMSADRGRWTLPIKRGRV